MAEDTKTNAEAAAAPLSGGEVSAFRSFLGMLGLGPKPDAAPGATVITGAAADSKAAADAKTSADAKAAADAKALAAATAATATETADKAAQERVNAMVIEAFRAVGAGLAPKAPAPSIAQWPKTQREVLAWASGSEDQRKALAAAVAEGLKYQQLPKY